MSISNENLLKHLTAVIFIFLNTNYPYSKEISRNAKTYC